MEKKPILERIGSTLRRYMSVVVTTAIVLAVPIAAFLLGWLPLPWAAESNTDKLALMGGLLAYLGTCFIGILAVWQNIRFKLESDRSQEKLEQAHQEAQSRVEEINARLLTIEEMRNKPVLRFFLQPQLIGDNLLTYDLTVENIGDTVAKDVGFSNIAVSMHPNIRKDPIYCLRMFTPGTLRAGEVRTERFTQKDLNLGEANGDLIFARVDLSFSDLTDRAYREKCLFFCQLKPSITQHPWRPIAEAEFDKLIDGFIFKDE